MKKLFVLIPLMLFSCTKKHVLAENTTKNDSVILLDQNSIDNKIDSAANGIVAIDELNATKASFKTFRVVDGDSIVKTSRKAIWLRATQQEDSKLESNDIT